MTPAHARLAIFFSAERLAELALAEAQRAYLLAAGWVRNPEGDHWAGEAWAPPDNPKGQWQLHRALERQRDEDVALVGEISVSIEAAPAELVGPTSPRKVNA